MYAVKSSRQQKRAIIFPEITVLVGVMATFSKEKEVTIYDTFDCPACGCQYIAQVRKRGYIDFGKEGDDKEDGREENE